MRATKLALLALVALPAAAPLAAQENVYVRARSPGWLGISYELRWVQEDRTCMPQIVVETVVQGSPAERAGLRAGDAIVALDGEPLPADRLQAVASRLAPGDSVRLRLVRDGVSREVTAVADRRPDRPLSVLLERSSGLRSSTAPVIEIVGDRLIARNIGPEWDPGRTHSYWVSQGDGRAEYHTLRSWSPSELDRRVASLLACADSARSGAWEWTASPDPARLEVRRLQERADSLRFVITRRALEKQSTQGVLYRTPGDAVPPEPATVRLLGPEGTLTFRIEDDRTVGLRGVAGAELVVLEPELAEYFRNADQGLLVLRIDPDTPAHRAGLRPGDVVIAADGRRLESLTELRRIIALPNAGDVELRVVRKGRIRDLMLRRE